MGGVDRRAVRREGAEAGDQLLPFRAPDDRPVFQGGAARDQAPADVGGLGAHRDVGHALGLRRQGRGAPGGDHPGQQRGRPGARRVPGCGDEGLVGGGVGRRLLHDQVGVGAADAERGHAGAAGPLAGGPRAGAGEEFHGAGRPVDLRGRFVHVERARQHALAHRHHHLDDPGDTCGGLGVTDVRLDGAQPQRPVLGTVLAVGGDQRLGLDRVAQRGAGAVRLDRVDVGGRQARVGQRLPDDALLGGAVGGGQAVARTVLVDRRAADDGEHPMPVPPRVGQPFQQQHPDALPRPEAVGGGREGPAAAVGRRALEAALEDEAGRGAHHRDPAGQGEGAFAVPQRLRREVHGHQRGRAGRVDRDRRSFETEGVGDPAGHHTGRVAGAEEYLDLVRGADDAAGVLGGQGAREDADLAAAQPGGGDPGPFERLPRRLQQQPLLRVHRQRLTRADAERRRVERGGVPQEAALDHVALARLLRVRVVKALQVPVPVGGELVDRVHLVADDPPQVLGRLDATGEPAGHADNGDRLVLLQLLDPAPDLAQVRRRPLEVLTKLLFVVHP